MKRIIMLLLMVPMIQLSLISHGVEIGILRGGVGIEAKYESDIPISGAKVTVYSPLDKGSSFCSGVTDKKGRFMFVPNSGGKWRVVIVDKTGHGGIKYIDVKKSNASKNVEKNRSVVGRTIKILSGVSVFFGITGLLFFILAVREKKKSMNAHS